MSKDRKEYMRAWYQAHKKECNARMKAWRESNKEYNKAYNEEHKEEIKEYKKEYNKDYYQAHKEEIKEYHKEYWKEYRKEDVNSFGETKESIRNKSRSYLKKYGKKIPGYEIHHCCSYTEPYKFIYCSKDKHKEIHAYLREHNIESDTDHYDLIKHLLDDKVVLYGI